MMLDTQELFSNNQLITSTAISTNVYDTNPVAGPNALQNIGTNGDIYLVVQTNAAFTASGSATLNITLESDSTDNLGTAPVVHYSSGALALAALTANTRVLAVRLPEAAYKRYVGLRYTVATGPMTGGGVDAFFTTDVNATRDYASGFRV